jgi:alkylation response protein AidB-like acyl-CoA dehydrogenase
VRLLKDAGLFPIYTPREFGELELPLPEGFHVVEEVSRHDGSTGWIVALGLANAVFTSMLLEASAARVLGNGAVLIAAAPAFGVRATSVQGGFGSPGAGPTTAARLTRIGSRCRPPSSMAISRAWGSVDRRWSLRLFLRRRWRSSTPGT